MSSDQWASGPPLGLLPHELLDKIVQGLFPGDVVSLAKTSRLMHQRMIPFLYTQVIITKQTWPLENLRNVPPLEELERTYFQEDGSRERVSILNFAMSLTIFPKRWSFSRCSLSNISEGSPPPSIQHATTLEAVSFAARQIFSQVQKGSLRHFGWTIGYCMPEELLGPLGYITISHTNLRSLSLVVDGSCPNNGLYGLAHLKNLQVFSWRGVVTKRNFKLLRIVLEHNAKHLNVLEVEIVRRRGASRHPTEIELDLIWLGLCVPSNHHIAKVEGAHLVKNRFWLKSLRTLSLRNASLAAWTACDTLTFDPGNLFKLKLELCVKTLQFFDTWDSRNHGLILRSFHSIIDERWRTRTVFPLERLIVKYGSRIEEFFVTFTDQFTVDIPFHRFRPYLRRMVLSFFKKRHGIRGEANLPDAYSILSILEVLSGLEGVAFMRSPYSVINKRKYLRGATPYPQLKVIHFRMPRDKMTGISPMVDYNCPTKAIIDSIKQFERYDTGNDTAVILSELVDFAAWAFDCTTFPSLEAIAMGDFAHPEACFVLRRRTDLPRYSQEGYLGPLMRAYVEYRRNDSTPMIPFDIVRPLDLRPWKGLEECRQMILVNSSGDPWNGF
uniref:F-box domain-containing protein n=1 Tax=Talaromyces marneffei PM1 TaxID=1077442 RepID=A0A093XVQ9_TALMA